MKWWERRAVAGLFGCAILATACGAPFARSKPSILEVESQAELREKFCAAATDREHILILPAALFVDGLELDCPGGGYRLYRVVSPEDPGDFLYFLDPPFGSAKRLGCDGKAGRGMATIAVNCRPE